MSTPVVSTEWLAKNLGRNDLLVFDATKYLPNQSGDPQAEFRAGHIPGARYFDIDAIADQDTDLPHMLPAPGLFRKKMKALGVSNDSFTVFYDNNGLAWSARGWWMMGIFGHDRAAVLDGGWKKWLAEGRAVETGTPPAPAPGKFRPDYRARRVRGIGDVLGNVTSGDELVLDARAAGRFRAEVPEPRAGMRAGHIPGSVNLPYSDLLAANGTLLAPEVLRAKLAAAGVDGRKPVVTSCGSGVSATVLTLAMVLAGLPAGAVYDGSWTEWGGRPDTPVET
jgi:thiosulfate/3-mercaptopyruvate sulfurtransferase